MASRSMQRHILAASFLIALFAGPASLGADDDDDDFLLSTGEDGTPQVIFYHGMVLDPNLRVIQPTFNNVSRVLRQFSIGLIGRSSDTGKMRSVQMLQEMQRSMAMDSRTEVLLYAALNRTMIKTELRQDDALDGTRRALETWASIPSGEGIDTQLHNDPRLLETLSRIGMDVAEETYAAPGDYIARCKAEGVPIPPDWSDPLWKYQADLDSNFAFAHDPGTIAKVWVYVDPAKPMDGTCVALPRSKPNGDITLFGIICQSKATGKACFWDNVNRSDLSRMNQQDSHNLKIAKAADGDLLPENCTNCHRGKNAFVIHPTTAVDIRKSFMTDPDVRYAPISNQTNRWGNPGPLLPKGSSECSMCHEIPLLMNNNNNGGDTTPGRPDIEAGPSYCRILHQVVDKTMPPGGDPAGWLNPHDPYGTDVDKLRTMCQAAH